MDIQKLNTADQLPSRKLDTSYANEYAYKIISYYSIPRTYRGFNSYASYKARDESIWRIGYGSTEIRDKVISGRTKATREEIDDQLQINAHYKGYLSRQKSDILAFKRDENLIIPKNMDYDNFSGLSKEVKSKFKKIRPKTMGQALRIDGITPAAVYILLSHLKRKSIKHIA